MKKELVIAKYERETDWLNQIDKSVRITVYNKNINTLLDGETYITPNVGRCLHTFFNHICKNYHSLSDVTFFAQDYPFDHVPNMIDIVNNFTLDYVCDNGMQIRDYYYPLGPANHVHSEPSGLIYGPMQMMLNERWEDIFESTEHRPGYLFTMVKAGHFVITKNGIQCKPLSFYEKIRDMLAKNIDVTPHEIERLEAYIFNPSIK